ncbi:cytochrome P450 [Streptomyces luteoverticillatus]|uniref:Cytochrome P450 n=1 Tax=Streptomyces luteoverticillatus TaxID=66425 RepID=A0A3S9PDZ2_STRLT|nr:cytochrome P450 [Streptomyces luteoverticillatus]
MNASARSGLTPNQAGTAWPLARTCPFQIPGEYADLRKYEPIARAQVWDGSRTWLITRHEHVRSLLADSRVTIRPAALPRLSAADSDGEGFRSLLTMDPPEHNTLRRMFIPEFSTRRVRAMRPGIERLVDDLIDKLLAGPAPADLVAELALPMSTLVICALLGVPYEDREFFQERSEIATRVGGDSESLTALLELRDYLDKLVTAKTKSPGDDLLSGIIVNRLIPGEIQHNEVVDNAVLLLAAGHETSASMAALGILTLLQHPETLAEVRADEGLLPQTIDELLRYLSIADGMRRAATADIELGGMTIRAGDGLIISLGSGNRDEDAFPSPDTFDIHRSARHHVAFGYGPHQCLGQNLARTELEVTLGAVIRRIPTLRLATDVEALRVKPDATIFGLHELPVEW